VRFGYLELSGTGNKREEVVSPGICRKQKTLLFACSLLIPRTPLDNRSQQSFGNLLNPKIINHEHQHQAS
jgi:hypothetical protein